MKNILIELLLLLLFFYFIILNYLSLSVCFFHKHKISINIVIRSFINKRIKRKTINKNSKILLFEC